VSQILRIRFAGTVIASLAVGVVAVLPIEPAQGSVIEHTCVKAGDLQAVIDAALPGDIIEVAAGVCTGKASAAEDF